MTKLKIKILLMASARYCLKYIKNKSLALYFTFSSFLTGRQHFLHNFLIYFYRSQRYDNVIKKKGFYKFKLNDVDCTLLSCAVSNLYESGTFYTMPTRPDEHANLRRYIDCNNPNVEAIIQKIIKSKEFQINCYKCIGDFKISSIMIWRNQSEDFTFSDKEVNSSYYHLDNGNSGIERNTLNIFMYLSNVSKEQGPFTYYDKNDSKVITRNHWRSILSRGNLRSPDLVKKIEEKIAPNLLIAPIGEALIIDNQTNLHRAGRVEIGFRDIIEICITPAN
jgi:hypothetical protein